VNEGARERPAEETATVEVTLPAFLLARASRFYKEALTAGFQETHTRVTHYKTDSAKVRPMMARTRRHLVP
jgi:hypothetical protein